jgi:hypothetical protein
MITDARSPNPLNGVLIMVLLILTARFEPRNGSLSTVQAEGDRACDQSRCVVTELEGLLLGRTNPSVAPLL